MGCLPRSVRQRSQSCRHRQCLRTILPSTLTPPNRCNRHCHFLASEGNNMSTKRDYRFAVVATNRGGSALPNLVIQFAYTRPAATLHKRDSEKRFQDTIFDIKPVRKCHDGVYVVTA